MKYLLSWIFSHIENPLSSKEYDNNIDCFCDYITKHVAEVTGYKKIFVNTCDWYYGIITTTDNLNTFSLRLNNSESIVLPARSKAAHGKYIVVKTINGYRWGTMEDCGSDLSGLLPPVDFEEKNFSFPTSDYCIEIDNKSIGNRFDLFSHRGIARELALFLKKNLIEEEKIFESINLEKSKNSSTFLVKNFSQNVQSVFACPLVLKEELSRANVAFSLAAIDQKPRSFLVDLSNFVMFDIGYPMHVFDKKEVGNSLVVKDMDEVNLELLDGERFRSKNSTVVMLNEFGNAISLPGIRGGLTSAVNERTKEIVLEAISYKRDHFCRYSAMIQIKTESSRRFEKNPCSYGGVLAIRRFIYLAKKFLFTFFESSGNFTIFVSNGGNLLQKESLERSVMFKKSILKGMLGRSFDEKDFFKIFELLGFLILKKGAFYKIFIPWWRSDIQIQEQIASEYLRIVGYTTVPLGAPSLPCIGIYKKRFIDRLRDKIASYYSAREVCNYGIISEKKLEILKGTFCDLVRLSNESVMIPSLFPHLIENMKIFLDEKIDDQRLFEINRIWRLNGSNLVKESVSAGILTYVAKGSINSLYKERNIFQDMLFSFGYRSYNDYVEYSGDLPFFSKNVMSFVKKKGEIYGHIGVIDHEITYELLGKEGILIYTKILDCDFLETIIDDDKSINVTNFFDFSFTKGAEDSLCDIISEIKDLDSSILSVFCSDWFVKEEWKDKISVTLRIECAGSFKKIIEMVKSLIHNKGLQIR